jgi:hypothetical protein
MDLDLDVDRSFLSNKKALGCGRGSGASNQGKNNPWAMAGAAIAAVYSDIA